MTADHPTSPDRRRLALGLGAFLLAGPALAASVDRSLSERAVQRARAMPRLHALIVARDGSPVVERHFRGPGLDRPANVKSVAKTVLSALVGAAIDNGVLEDVDQPVAPLLGDLVPRNADPRVRTITVDHLLSMRAGLERTSGANYGRWVASPDWVRYALSRPFVDEPGGRMLYSTGSWHVLSAVLTRASGRSTLDLAREWLGRPLGVEIPPWVRDPQGIYLGGNDMALSPRALLRFAEMYRQGGVYGGRRVLPESWVRRSWVPRGRSPWSGDTYGYGWFITRMAGRETYYGRGYGGQLVHVVPDLGLSAVMLSDPTPPSPGGGYVRELHALLERDVIRAISRS
jgi:CubicO group peptidase (beta-lactamase class C family)